MHNVENSKPLREANDDVAVFIDRMLGVIGPDRKGVVEDEFRFFERNAMFLAVGKLLGIVLFEPAFSRDHAFCLSPPSPACSGSCPRLVVRSVAFCRCSSAGSSVPNV